MYMKKLLGSTLIELQDICSSLQMPKFRAKQIASWLYEKRVHTIDEMTNLSLADRENLKNKYVVGLEEPIKFVKSVDGTIKYLYEVDSLYQVESVYIPDKERATLCISSQVGCKMNCHFCMTGKQGFSKNLTSGEIINQILALPEFEQLTNVVLMGMGEPLDNVDEVLKALSIMTSPWGLAWSPKRITLSTIGVKPKLERFLNESDCHLAVSLHAPVSSQRLKIMPVEKAYPIADVVDMLKDYDFSKQRRVTFEYILFKDFNDSKRDADSLIALLDGLPCRVNLIRFHAIPEVNLEGTAMEDMIKFRDYLTAKGLHTTIRASRGEDIFAACGMLSTLEKKDKTFTD